MNLDYVAVVERHFGIRLKQVSANEWRSLNGCPQCGDGGKGSNSDRFRVFIDDHPLVWCRRCGYTAFIDNLDKDSKPTQAEINERRLRSLEQAREEHERRLSALERMAQSQDHIWYHKRMTGEHREYWHSEGMLDETIENFMLGYCPLCHTDKEHRPSYTIPVFSGGNLVNIRHRLIGGDQSDKYRPHMSGLGAQLFNTQSLSGPFDTVVLWEGEKKTIVMQQYMCHLANVGTMGKRTFKNEWIELLRGFKEVIIAFDPDAKRVLSCDLCDGDPTCVKFCSTHALKYVEATAANRTYQKEAVARLYESKRGMAESLAT